MVGAAVDLPLPAREESKSWQSFPRHLTCLSSPAAMSRQPSHLTAILRNLWHGAGHGKIHIDPSSAGGPGSQLNAIRSAAGIRFAQAAGSPSSARTVRRIGCGHALQAIQALGRFFNGDFIVLTRSDSATVLGNPHIESLFACIQLYQPRTLKRPTGKWKSTGVGGPDGLGVGYAGPDRRRDFAFRGRPPPEASPSATRRNYESVGAF
jgi:hypothetical protein